MVQHIIQFIFMCNSIKLNRWGELIGFILNLTYYNLICKSITLENKQVLKACNLSDIIMKCAYVSIVQKFYLIYSSKYQTCSVWVTVFFLLWCFLFYTQNCWIVIFCRISGQTLRHNNVACFKCMHFKYVTPVCFATKNLLSLPKFYF